MTDRDALSPFHLYVRARVMGETGKSVIVCHLSSCRIGFMAGERTRQAADRALHPLPACASAVDRCEDHELVFDVAEGDAPDTREASPSISARPHAPLRMDSTSAGGFRFMAPANVAPIALLARRSGSASRWA